MDDNKSIKCDVENCIYNDEVCKYCTLSEIKISKTTNTPDKKETICDSFKAKNS